MATVPVHTCVPAGKLQHVAVSLPPPARMEAAAAAAGQYPRATQLAIAKLLTACGLSSAFIGGIKHSSRDSLLACESVRAHVI